MDPARWQRIEEVFNIIVERPAYEREAHLTRICGGDEELRRARNAAAKLQGYVAADLNTNWARRDESWHRDMRSALKELDSALATPPAPRTLIGTGQPLPPGVWMCLGEVTGFRRYVEGGATSVDGVTYTYVGPVPSEEERK